jgi:hypothetical protein
LSRFLRRVTVCFALLVVLTWANGFFAIAQLGRFDDESHDAIEGGLASTAVLGQLASSLASFRTLEATALAAAALPGTDRPVPVDRQRDRLREQVERLSRQYESLDSSDEQKRLFMRFLTGWYDYEARSRLVYRALATGQRAAAQSAFAADRDAFDDASAAVAELIRITTVHGHAIEEDLHGIFRSSLWFLLAAAAGISILVVGLVVAFADHE